jgi:hypothetical protein
MPYLWYAGKSSAKGPAHVIVLVDELVWASKDLASCIVALQTRGLVVTIEAHGQDVRSRVVVTARCKSRPSR